MTMLAPAFCVQSPDYQNRFIRDNICYELFFTPFSYNVFCLAAALLDELNFYECSVSEFDTCALAHMAPQTRGKL